MDRAGVGAKEHITAIASLLVDSRGFFSFEALTGAGAAVIDALAEQC
jgi:hypothetical protein